MSKLFLFGIGGTGSRVVKSLTMLMASGIETNDHEIVPIIIDPDRSNGDLNRTSQLLDNYMKIRNELSFDFNSFFKSKISTLSSIAANPVQDGFHFNIEGVNDQQFKDFIDSLGLEQMKGNDALVKMLFSRDNLDSTLEVGFKGNPNIGSVVLSNFSNSNVFTAFASNFEEGDKIFIISSIFGGTGAAGFPLLLKTLREVGNEVPNFNLIKNAPIGGISVLPYFGVALDPNSQINEGTFISKTKAALEYYSRTIVAKKAINAMYYIGDTVTKEYSNNEGAENQKNNAHLVEFLGASSIIDFLNLQQTNFEVSNGVALNPIFKEFGIDDDNNSNELTFSTFPEVFIAPYKKSISKLYLTSVYLRDRLDSMLGKTQCVWSRKGLKLDKPFFQNDAFYVQHFESFLKDFHTWLDEMKDNRRSFVPFMDFSGNNLFSVLKDFEPKSRLLSFRKGYWEFQHELNKANKIVPQENKANKLLSLFSVATKELLNKKFEI